MRRFSLVLVVLACVAVAALLTWLALSSASFGGHAPRSSPSTERTDAPPRALPPFTRLEVSGGAEVLLVQGASESVAFATDARPTRFVEAEVTDGVLAITSNDQLRWWDVLLGRGGSRPTQVVVTFRELASIDVAGGVKLTAGAFKADALKISGAGGTAIRIDALDARTLHLSGAGALRADLAGRVNDQTITISGAGDYRGAKLASQNATVTVAGAGQVVVNAEKTLRANISGAGTVDYVGDPQVTESVSGVGRVRRRNA